MKTSDIMALCMVGAVISFLGFLVENIWVGITKGYMDNRSMFLPFLIGYGIAVALIFVVLGTPKKLWILGKTLKIKNRIVKVIVYFIEVAICVSIGEILLGTIVEKVCHFQWWNYSKIPLHITQYTSVPTSAGFSALITTFMNWVFEPIFYFFKGWDYEVLCLVGGVLTAAMIIDYLYNMYLMYKKQGHVQRWKIDTTGTKIYKFVHGL